MTRTTDSTTAAKSNDAKRNRDRRTMGDVSHTNPYTGESTGHLFSRGPIVAADGGEANAVPEERTDDRVSSDPADGNDRMKDVSHTPPRDAADANAVFERGGTEVGADE